MQDLGSLNFQRRRQRGVEVWRQIPRCDGAWVSNLGRVWFLGTPWRPVRKLGVPRGIRPQSNNRGYRYVQLTGGGGSDHFVGVHRLVMLAFVGWPPSGHQVDHIDGNRANNRLDNLRYVTAEENVQAAVRRKKILRGSETVGNVNSP